MIAVWSAVSLFAELSAYREWWLGLIGFTWGFHVVFTVYMLSQPQPDVEEHGKFFSYSIIYLANLFFVSLWIIITGAPTFRAAGARLCDESAAAYSAVWNGIIYAVDFCRAFFQK